MPETLKKLIRDIPDFPKPGIVFKDITPLFQDPAGLQRSLVLMASLYERHMFDVIAGIESRGFFFAPTLARDAGVGFVPIRKPGKLPYETVTESYANEYGTDTIEVHRDAFGPGRRVLVVDDVLATGGTARAACKLVEQTGAEVVGTLFLIELGFLDGRKLLERYAVRSVLTY